MKEKIEILPLEIGYMAGLVDGEGCIGVCINKTGERRKNPSYRIRIKIAMCEIGSIKYVQSIFGGSYRVQKRKNPKHRALYEWQVRSNEALFVLKIIEPYLKIKKDQARLAIELQERVKQSKLFVKGKKGIQPLNKEEVILRKNIYEQIKELNTVGVR